MFINKTESDKKSVGFIFLLAVKWCFCSKYWTKYSIDSIVIQWEANAMPSFLMLDRPVQYGKREADREEDSLKSERRHKRRRNRNETSKRENEMLA